MKHLNSSKDVISHFPQLIARNLEGEKIEIPQSFHGDFNLVLVAFKRWHQSLVNQWVSLAQFHQENRKILDIYELPTLDSSYKLAKFWIDGGMRLGIPDKTIRKHTITLYLNKREFDKKLGIKNEDTIQVLVLDNDGAILWREEGKLTGEKKKIFEIELQKLGIIQENM